MIKVTSFYKFFSIEKNSLGNFQEELRNQALKLNIRGLILIAHEGINAVFCGKEESVEIFKKFIGSLFNEPFFWKDSYCEKWSFKSLSVKVKGEIINSGVAGPLPNRDNGHLSPKEWQEKLHTRPQILDVRNTYEVELGRFQGAKDLQMDSFHEFSEKLKNLKMDKAKETLIYCTGGIRCERAIEIMKDKGFKRVHQLEGGILNYLKEYPRSYFEEECFVFDHRVALNQDLKASEKYSLCPHCGQPGDLLLDCKYCDKPAVICKSCKDQFFYYETCSKNCAYHFKSGHICRKKYQTPSLSK